MDFQESGLLRTLCFFDTQDYAPTKTELMAHWDTGSVEGGLPTRNDITAACDRLLAGGTICEKRGRLFLSGREELVSLHETRAEIFPRKLRRARTIVRWLSRLGGVRFVALCNTTAVGHARDESDLDFFIIAKNGSLWQTRFLSVLPFLRSRVPIGQPEKRVTDPVCLSFFIDDSALSLQSLALQPSDPYFRCWFLSLLPLFDDGVSREFWDANKGWLAQFPFAERWIATPGPEAPRFRIPVLPIERWAERFQRRRFPQTIKERMNKDTAVRVDDHTLKFHMDDHRARFLEAYRHRCQAYGITP
ncbi:MAG: hypothetical protein Q7R83_03940 [bacterium]|nr:hypothetical protein [bacterium]